MLAAGSRKVKKLRPPAPSVTLLTRFCICRAGHPGEAVARKALSPRRGAFKGLLKKGSAGGKENSSGQTEPMDPMKLQQLQSQALSEVAAAAGITTVAQGSDLRVLCLQVGPGVACLLLVKQLLVCIPWQRSLNLNSRSLHRRFPPSRPTASSKPSVSGTQQVLDALCMQRTPHC